MVSGPVWSALRPALWPTGPLVALAAALGAVVVFETRPSTPPLPATAPPLAAETVRPATRAAVDFDRVEAVALARPLFATGRRPRKLAAETAKTAASALPRVSGTILGAGRKLAIFAGAGEARPLVVAEGGSIEGFRVTAIAPGRVTLSGPSGLQVLLASLDPNRPPPPPPPPAPLPVYPGLPALLPPAQPAIAPVASLALPAGSAPTQFPPPADLGMASHVPGLPTRPGG